MDQVINQCGVCEQPMLPGQALNGITRTHWECKPPLPNPACVPSVKKPVNRGIKSPTAPSAEVLKRFDWIEDWLRTTHAGAEVDVLDTAFVLAYIEAHNAPCQTIFIGAPRCPQLGRDLGWMFKLDRLSRVAVGLAAGDASIGFPKWVYSYRLK